VARGSATEVASIGPITITYAFRSWVLLEVPGHGSVRKRVRSEDELGSVLNGLGVPAAEIESIADRLWDARPGDAGRPKVSASEGFVPSTGFTRTQLFLAVLAIAAIAGLILWFSS
jgi:hypothetical protein